MKLKQSLLIICIFFLSLTFIAITSAITIKDVSSSPNEIVPGEIASISIEIENIFDYDATNVNVKIDLSEVPFAPYQSSSEEYLEELEEGDEEKFNFKLIVLPESKSGIYKIPVLITYEDDKGNITLKKGLISLIVNSQPELKVSLEDSVVLIKGKENEIEIKIVNSGLSDVKFVYLGTSDVSGIKFLAEKEQYIGDISSDDFDSIKYKIYLNPNAPNIINLPVVLRYKDATNKEHIQTEVITIKTYSLKEAQDLGLVKKGNYTLYFVIGGIILGFIIYRFIKKKKLKKKREG